MSLVNDMLRDLEARRAAPDERVQLDGLLAVDETAARRRERLLWLYRGLYGVAALVLLGLLLGQWATRQASPPAVPAEVPAAPAPERPAGAQLLEVLPQHDGRGLVLQLLLDRSVAYRRTEQRGAVSLTLPAVHWAGAAQHGRVQVDGRSLSWHVEGKADEVRILLVGLADGPAVRERLEPVGDRWLLWIEAPLTEPQEQADEVLALDDLPVAEAADDAQLPTWGEAPAALAQDSQGSAAAIGEATAAGEKAEALAELLDSPAEVKIAPHQPDVLMQARQALQEGDHARAIGELEALLRQRGDDPQVVRWLARAYWADGQQQRLLGWLPAQLQRLPQDSELRVLLARSQLQVADAAGAVATLQGQPPALAQQPTYHALLAASYQQSGQWAQSAAVYRQLLALSPQQATWRLGLAIALEQQDRPAEAGHHYGLALRGTGLDGDARRFAGERAAALGDRR